MRAEKWNYNKFMLQSLRETCNNILSPLTKDSGMHAYIKCKVQAEGAPAAKISHQAYMRISILLGEAFAFDWRSWLSTRLYSTNVLLPQN